MTREELINNLNQWVKLSERQIKQIDQYKTFLQKKNQEFNLTRLDSEDKIYGEYFYDSIIPYKDLDFNAIHSLLDVGSGSGIPGILLKILFPNLTLTIVESITKKTEFLVQLTEELGLKEVIILNTRAEELSNEYRNSFDLVTARAVADLDILLEITVPFVKMEGLCVFPKGKNTPTELQNAKQIIRKLKVELVDNVSYVNSLGYKQYILYFKKDKETPSIYPRNWKSILHDHNLKKE